MNEFEEPILAEIVLDSSSRASQEVTVFSAPRKFDLATLLAVTTAYALMFAGMRAFDANDAAMLWTGAFVSIIAAGQAILFGGNAPRASSMIVGSVLVAFTMLVAVTGLNVLGLFTSVLVGGLLGPPSGYLSGTLVGGVFLIAHHLRIRFGI
ncbi:MAG: hypothetical protein R3C05_05125 [Pirellulaceae bacterium]